MPLPNVMPDRPIADFKAFCTSLIRALEFEAPDVAEAVHVEDVEAWVGQQWPLPPAAMLSTPIWARAYLAQCFAS